MKVCWKTRCLMGTKGCWWPREVSAGCWNAKWKPNPHYFTALIGWLIKCTGLKVRQQIVLPAIITWGSVVLVLFSSSVREPRTRTLKSHWRNDRITWGAAFRESWKIHKKRKQTKDYSSEMEQWNKQQVLRLWRDISPYRYINIIRKRFANSWIWGYKRGIRETLRYLSSCKEGGATNLVRMWEILV